MRPCSLEDTDKLFYIYLYISVDATDTSPSIIDYFILWYNNWSIYNQTITSEKLPTKNVWPWNLYFYCLVFICTWLEYLLQRISNMMFIRIKQGPFLIYDYFYDTVKIYCQKLVVHYSMTFEDYAASRGFSKWKFFTFRGSVKLLL